MSKACTILAHVRNSEGEIVESRLFKDLLHYTSNNRTIAKQYYAIGTDKGFLTKVRDSEKFQTDENGEITFKSLKELADLDLDTDQLAQVLNEDIGSGVYDYGTALKKIQEFNANNAFSGKMLATMVQSSKDKYYVSVVPIKQNSEAKQALYNTVRNKELENKIVTLLKSHGVATKFIESESAGGRYSTENAVQTEDGLYSLIEISQGGNVTDTLAEEAGHFAVGALGDNTLVRRLEDILKSQNAQREALGEEEYQESDLGKNPAREVAGRLVGKALQRKLDNSAPYKVLANRIANLAKRIFYSFTGNEVRWAAVKAEQLANKIAYDFVEGNNNFSIQNALSIQETMHNAVLSTNKLVYRDAMDELGRLCKQLKAIAQDAFTDKMQASMAMSIMAGTDSTSGVSALQNDDKINAFADTLAFDGIAQALVQISDYIGPNKEIDKMMKAVNLQNPSDFYAHMARNGRYLRQARAFIRSAEIIIDTIQNALDPNFRDGMPLTINGTSIQNVRYQDENGAWKTINMQQVLVNCKNALAAHISELNNLESSYFARFCEDIYGSKYITTSVNKTWHDIWNGQQAFGEQTINIAAMVRGEGMEDIDVFHRYLGSMSNNPDVIGQIVDRLVKTANKNADDMALHYQEQLIILKDRADKLGLDMADLMEKSEILDKDGNGTGEYDLSGNMITPPARPTQSGDQEEDFIVAAYLNELGTDDVNEIPAFNFGNWERKLEAKKKALWEDFKTKNPDWETMSGFVRGFKWDEFCRKEMKNWHKANSIKVEVKDKSGNIQYVKWIPNKIYATNAWDNIKAKYNKRTDEGDTIDQWVHDYRQIKSKLDAMLPVGSTTSYRLPQFRGTFMNSVRQSRALEKGSFKGLKAWAKTFGRRSILENFVETSEDTDYGDLNSMNHPDEELLGTKLDYESERAARLPIFGVRKLENMQDLSSDLLHSMLSYASMATSYAALNDVVDSLEVGREALYNRKIQSKVSSAEKKLTNIGDPSRVKGPTGKYETYLTGTKNRAYGRYIKFLDKQVYGISATHWGIPIGKGRRILLNKVIQNISSLGGTLFLKGNVLGGAVNTLTGFNNIFKEAITGSYFNAKDWAKAHDYYFRQGFVPMWLEAGKLKKNNKLSLFLEQMNASSDNRTKFRDWRTSRNRLNNFYRMMWYLPYSSGDHYMQAMSYLAVANGTKLYNIDGSLDSNLWDAYKREENKDEFNRFSAGYRLEFNRICPIDAKEITTDALDTQGTYLKAVDRSSVMFNEWLIWQDSAYADEAYKSQHPNEVNYYRDQFDHLSDEELMKWAADKYDTLSNILRKVETYIANAGSPLISAPVFSAKELEYMNVKKVGPGNYQDVLQVCRNDIFNMIWTKADESAYMDKCREVNNRLHGIYNQQDKTAWHQQWYTNAFLAMKGWALGYLEMMYSNTHHSIALGREVEGFVNTTAKMLGSTLMHSFNNDIQGMAWRDCLISLVCPWSKRSKKAMKEAGFSDEQNMNARRMTASIALMILLAALKSASAAPDDDEEEVDPALGLVYYLSMRTLLEQEAFLWTPEMFVQSGELLDFLPVGFAALYDIGKLVKEGVGTPFADIEDKKYYWQKDDPNGRYEKYDSKFVSHLERITPYWKSWWGVLHPYEAAENYQFGRKLRSR